MNEIVIACHADGTVEHTLKDSLFKFPGQRHVERVTLIEFSDMYQKFYIVWLMGPYVQTFATACLNAVHWREYGFARPPAHSQTYHPEDVGIYYFDTYEHAVEAEVVMLNAMRLAGVRFDV